MISKEIQDDKWYTLRALINLNAFPWLAGNYMAYRPFVAEEKNKAILKPFTRGEDNGKTGTGKRYYFKGANVRALIEKVESGKH